jgi:cytidine deaminase
MKNHKLSIIYYEYESINELNKEDRLLLAEAEKALHCAYSPYSGFSVGAALELATGVVVTGNNQENAAYPSGLCAERVAMFAASSQYPGIPFKAIAITAKSDKFLVDYPVSPCGACRQVMAEYENSRKAPIRIILQGESGKIIIFDKSNDLLPFVFNSDQLKSK